MNYQYLRVDFGDTIPVVTICRSNLVEVEDSDMASAEIKSLQDFGNNIILDLSGVDFLAEGVWGALVTLHLKLNNSGGKLVLCGAKEPVLGKMRGYRLDKLFNVAEDKKTALGQF